MRRIFLNEIVRLAKMDGVKIDIKKLTKELAPFTLEEIAVTVDAMKRFGYTAVMSKGRR